MPSLNRRGAGQNQAGIYEVAIRRRIGNVLVDFGGFLFRRLTFLCVPGFSKPTQEFSMSTAF